MIEKASNKHKIEEIAPGEWIRPALDIVESADKNVYTKINFLSGLSIATILFVINLIFKDNFNSFRIYLKLSVAILLIGSFITSMLCLSMVFTKKSIKEPNILWPGRVKKYWNMEKYKKQFSEELVDSRKMVENFADYIYWYSNTRIIWRNKLVKLATKIYIITIILTVILALLHIIIK
jgi:hypothetical protein